MSDEREKLYRYLTRQLRSGVAPHDLWAELVRHGVPKEEAWGHIQEVRRALGEAIQPPQPFPPERIERPALAEYAVLMLDSGYDIHTVLELAEEQGYSREEVLEVLSQSPDPRAQSLLAAIPSPAEEAPALPGRFERVPISPENAAGELSPEQRRCLGMELRRCLGMLALVVPASGVLVWFLLQVGLQLSAPPSEVAANPSIVASLAGLFIRLVWPLALLFLGVGVCVIGAVALIVDVGRLLLDLFPGRVGVVRGYLFQPFDTVSGDHISYTVTVRGFPKRFHLWGKDLYDLVGRWGLQCPYDIYLSPHSRRIWHLEPVEE